MRFSPWIPWTSCNMIQFGDCTTGTSVSACGVGLSIILTRREPVAKRYQNADDSIIELYNRTGMTSLIMLWSAVRRAIPETKIEQMMFQDLTKHGSHLLADSLDLFSLYLRILHANLLALTIRYHHIGPSRTTHNRSRQCTGKKDRPYCPVQLKTLFHDSTLTRLHMG